MAKGKGLYATEPVAPGKKVANKNPVGSPEPVGNFRSPTVPEHAGQLHGLGPISKPFRQHQVKGAHGYGHVGGQKQGHLRLSGYTDAHRLGANTKHAFKTPKLNSTEK